MDQIRFAPTGIGGRSASIHRLICGKCELCEMDVLHRQCRPLIFDVRKHTQLVCIRCAPTSVLVHHTHICSRNKCQGTWRGVRGVHG